MNCANAGEATTFLQLRVPKMHTIVPIAITIPITMIRVIIMKFSTIVYSYCRC